MSQFSPWVVVKFGGKSVSTLVCWETITKLVKKHLQDNKRVIIICSALTLISDKLEGLLEAAINDDQQTLFNDIIQSHIALAASLSQEGEALLRDEVCALKDLVTGVSLVKEISPRVRAQVMAYGELMLTKIGAAYLKAQAMDVAWADSRTLLKTKSFQHAGTSAEYLAAQCDHAEDPALQAKLDSMHSRVILTQGFIASNAEGETVLLGRGGSDTSAAYYAAKCGAVRCEIWTDVPGIYTANPRIIPNARRIKNLAYDEAQEIASLGGKVLHPNCIFPAAKQHIPLYVGYTFDPQREGTLICADGPRAQFPIKAIITKNHVLLISIDTVNMWQQIGFLADVFTCFKKQGLSVDLMSSSESNVTVSLDFKAHQHNPRSIDRLLEELNIFSKARMIGPCAQVSLVGHNIRSILHQLGETFEVFEEQKIYMISQASNDLNLTFVVDESQAERLAVKLHALLIESQVNNDQMDKTWREEFGEQEVANMPHWWQDKQEALITLAKSASPVFVYHAGTVKAAAERLLAMKSVDRIFYAMKANNHPDIVKQLYAMGIGVECVSQGELTTVFSLIPDIDPSKIMFTPNFAPREEYAFALSKGVIVNIDNLHPLVHWPELFKGREVFLRIDSGEGAGHHKYVCTAGSESKFGISLLQFDALFEAINHSGANVVGLHCHSGSGILEPDIWERVAHFLSSLLVKFPQVRTLNLGGGLGVVEKPGQKPLDVDTLDALLQTIKVSHPALALWLEPGRYLVAAAGVLLAKVTQIKQKGAVNFMGIDTGMNSLIRPVLYGSYHEIVNLSRLNDPQTLHTNIVGPICESGDTLGFSRKMPRSQEGDVILIGTSGAYGHVMSSHYNLREPATEIYIAE